MRFPTTSSPEWSLVLNRLIINTPEDLKIAYECGAFGAIVGSAITRPQLIAKNFVNVLKDIDIK